MKQVLLGILRLKNADMKYVFVVLIMLVGVSVYAQNTQNADTITCPANLENIYARVLYTDSLSSSFVIFIKKEVKLHKHQHHTEHVMVLEGEATMTLGDKVFKIKKGDVVFIPKNTPHSVVTTSAVPLKVISLQAPNFDGSDRILLE
jgi:mannose-6-phosphate isomerase-like protein (cupin superfamily)